MAQWLVMAGGLPDKGMALAWVTGIWAGGMIGGWTHAVLQSWATFSFSACLSFF